MTPRLGSDDEAFEKDDGLLADNARCRWSFVLDCVQDAVFLIDRRTLRVAYVNQAAIDRVGYAPAELVGMDFAGLTLDTAGTDLDDTFASRGSSERRSRVLATILRHKDGTLIPVELLITIPPDSPEELAVVVAREGRGRLRAATTARWHGDEQTAEVEVRDRAVRDLYDTLVRRMFRAALTLYGAIDLTREAPVVQRLEEVVAELDLSIRELRVAAVGVGARPAQAPGLRGEVVEIVAAAERAFGLKPVLAITGPVDTAGQELTAHVAAALREMLSNVARHARASSVRVEVIAEGDLAVRVTDDGVGLAAESGPRGGHGLKNLAELAVLCGGEFSLTVLRPSGTLAEWRAPLA